MSLSVILTYGGVPTPIYLPRYLGADGTVTAETQYPVGYTDQPTSNTAATAWSGSLNSTSSRPATKTKIGPIVGGVVGGVVLLATIGVGIFILMRKKKKRRAVGLQQYTPVEKTDVPVGGRMELNGQPKTPFELTAPGKPKTAFEMG